MIFIYMIDNNIFNKVLSLLYFFFCQIFRTINDKIYKYPINHCLLIQILDSLTKHLLSIFVRLFKFISFSLGLVFTSKILTLTRPASRFW